MNFDNKQFIQSINIFRRNKNRPAGSLQQSWKKYHEPGLYEYVMYLSSIKRVFFSNLLAGIGRGLGFVLGATVVVALLVYIIGKILVDIPIVGKSFQKLDQVLQQSLEKTPINYQGGRDAY